MAGSKRFGRPSDLSMALGVLAVGLAFYLWTLAPTLLWGDSAYYQELAYLGQIPRGLRAHPLWVAMAHPLSRFPVGDAAYRANLASAIFAAGALAFLYLAISLLTRHRQAALLAAGVLAVSHTFWLHAVIAEVYSLNTFFLVMGLYLALRWGEGIGGKGTLYSLAFLTGLSLANHLLMLTALPGLALVTSWKGKRSLSFREIASIGLCFLMGTVPFIYWELTPSWQAGELFLRPEGGGASLRGFLLALGYLGYQFFLSLPLAIVGFIHLARTRNALAAGLMLIYLGDFLFVLNFRVPDQYAFYLLSYIIVAVWCGVGLAEILPRLGHGWGIRLGLILALLLLPIVTYCLAPSVNRNASVIPVPLRPLATRDPYRYFLFPSKRGDRGARLFAEDTLHRLPPEALLLADWTLRAPLDYLQKVEGWRTDVEIVETLSVSQSQVAFLLEGVQERPLFIADNNQYYEMSAIGEHFQVLPFGYIYRLEPKGGR